MEPKNKLQNPFSPKSQEEDPEAPPAIEPYGPAFPEWEPDLIPEEIPIPGPPFDIPLDQV